MFPGVKSVLISRTSLLAGMIHISASRLCCPETPFGLLAPETTGNYQGISIFQGQFRTFPPGILASFPWVTAEFPAPQEQGI